MRVWISGIAGFLGSHLADTLIAEGHDVGGNDNLICGDMDNVPKVNSIWDGSTLSIGKPVFYEEDCCNFNGMKEILDYHKPDVLVHCAATAHEGLSSFSPSFITRNIYEASVSTFSAAIASGVKRIVYMSSMSRYGKGSELPPFAETFRPLPVDPYGIAKVAAEDTLRVLCQTHDVKYSILVPHNIIGTRQRYIDPFRNVASIMMNRCKQGKPPIIYGDGAQMRSFSPVKDCLPSIVQAIHGAADGEVVNIGPDHCNMSIYELSQIVSEMTGYTGEPMYFPDRPNEVKIAHCSSAKARRLLGYEIKQSLMDCLKEMCDAIEPKDFVYDFPLEIVTDKTPITWKERLI